MKCHLIVFGTGSLAKALLYSLPMIQKSEFEVLVIGRDEDEVLKITTIANSRAIFCSSKINFTGETHLWDDDVVLEDIINILLHDIK